MNCAYHIHNPAVVNCNGCGKPLCPACDHRIKGFPYCQDCIVMGVDLLNVRGLEAMELEKPVVLGCSIGGRIACRIFCATRAASRGSANLPRSAHGHF